MPGRLPNVPSGVSPSIGCPGAVRVGRALVSVCLRRSGQAFGAGFESDGVARLAGSDGHVATSPRTRDGRGPNVNSHPGHLGHRFGGTSPPAGLRPGRETRSKVRRFEWPSLFVDAASSGRSPRRTDCRRAIGSAVHAPPPAFRWRGPHRPAYRRRRHDRGVDDSIGRGVASGRCPPGDRSGLRPAGVGWPPSEIWRN